MTHSSCSEEDEPLHAVITSNIGAPCSEEVFLAIGNIDSSALTESDILFSAHLSVSKVNLHSYAFTVTV